MHAAIQRLPFDWLEHNFAGQITIDAGKKCGVEDAPGDDGEQGRGTLETLERAKLAGFNAAAALDYPVPCLDRPAPCIPRQPLEGLLGRVRGHRAESIHSSGSMPAGACSSIT